MDDELLNRTAMEWMSHLETKLRDQARHAETYDAYYSGDRRITLIDRDFSDVFDGLFDAVRVNTSRIVIDAQSERLQVDGFRVPDEDGAPTGDEERQAVARAAASIWRRNDLDEMSSIAHLEVGVKALVAVLVWPDADGRAVISIEDPTQMVVARRPSPPYDVVAALKKWQDDWGVWWAELYLAGAGLHRFRSASRAAAVGDLWVPSSVGLGGTGWVPAEGTDGVGLVEPLPTGAPPIVELAGSSRLLRPPVSNLVDIAPLHDAYDKVTADLIIAASFSAIPLRTVAGAVLKVNNKGRPVDDDGREIDPYATRGDRVWVSTSKDTRFGTLEGGSLEQFVKARSAILTDIRGRSRVPLHYFDVGGTSGTGAEMLKALEGPLVRWATGWQQRIGPGWRRVMSLALEIERSPWAGVPLETVWADTETRADASAADAFLKFGEGGVPLQVRMRRLGFSEEDIAVAVAKEAELAAQDAALVLAEEARLRAAAAEALDSRQDEDVTVPAGLSADEIKKRADAMGVLIRAGVEPEDAARITGLQDVDFTGAVPVALRLPGTQAERFEG